MRVDGSSDNLLDGVPSDIDIIKGCRLEKAVSIFGDDISQFPFGLLKR